SRSPRIRSSVSRSTRVRRLYHSKISSIFRLTKSSMDLISPLILRYSASNQVTSSGVWGTQPSFQTFSGWVSVWNSRSSSSDTCRHLLGHLVAPSFEQATVTDKASPHLHQTLAASADDASGLPRPERHHPGLGVVKQLYPLPGVDSQFPTDLLGDDDPPEIIRLQNNPRLVKHATTSMY